ncbi:MAG: bL17 family ribosomal protein [Patescibacteria group bacterium]
MWRVLRAQSDFKDTTLRNQLTSLVLYEAIVTSRLSGKSLVSFADRFFHRVKKADLLAHKYAHSVLMDKNAVRKVFEDIMPRYELTATNYVRSLSAAPRRGDNAAQLAVMLIKEAKIEPDSAKATTGKPESAKATTDKSESAKPSKVLKETPVKAKAVVPTPLKLRRARAKKAK